MDTSSNCKIICKRWWPLFSVAMHTLSKVGGDAKVAKAT